MLHLFFVRLEIDIWYVTCTFVLIAECRLIDCLEWLCNDPPKQTPNWIITQCMLDHKTTHYKKVVERKITCNTTMYVLKHGLDGKRYAIIEVGRNGLGYP